MPQAEVCGLAFNTPPTEVARTHTVTGQEWEVNPFLVGSGFQRRHCLFPIVIIFHFPGLVGITSGLTHEVGFEEYNVLKNMYKAIFFKRKKLSKPTWRGSSFPSHLVTWHLQGLQL